MLRVGLTGELGSGKSTVARLFAERGAVVLSSDEMGRAMMQPGEPVYRAIVEHFGRTVVGADGLLDREALARLAFDPEQPRVEELNAIVHPAVIAEQERRIGEIAGERPDAVVVIESALIFTTKHAGDDEPWRKRFDRIVLVTAPDEVKVQRFVDRMVGTREVTTAEREALRTDAQRRLAAQRVSPVEVPGILRVENNGAMDDLEAAIDRVWMNLKLEADRLRTRN